MAFGNRVEDSFARLNQAKEAPNRISWGEFDRNALVRLPITATDQTGRQVTMPTIEFRLPDGSALPHLLMAGVAVAMLEGRGEREPTWTSCCGARRRRRARAVAWRAYLGDSPRWRRH